MPAGHCARPGYAEGDLFTVQGSMIPFAATEAERQRTSDPRPSLAARYARASHGRAKLAEAADRLVADRLLLPEDADRLIERRARIVGRYQVL